MRGVVCHAREGLFTGKREPVTVFKQSCGTVISGSFSWRSGGFTVDLSGKTGRLLRCLGSELHMK